jgi:hypothetical protein
MLARSAEHVASYEELSRPAIEKIAANAQDRDDDEQFDEGEPALTEFWVFRAPSAA